MDDSKLFLPQFAAQAVVDLEFGAKVFKKIGDARSAMFSTLAELIRGAVHIVLPNRGEIYRDNKGVAAIPTTDECESFIGIPAPVCCFEYPWAYDYKPHECLIDHGDINAQSTKRLTLVIDGKQAGQSSPLPFQSDDRVVLISVVYMPSTRLWGPHQAILSVPSPLCVKPAKDPYAWGLLCGIYDIETLSQLEPTNARAHLWASQMKPDVIAVVQCCHALRAGAVFREVTEPHASRRWKFERKGCGGFTYHVLEIPNRSSPQESRESGGTHSSPRRHIRRAHIRKLPTGALTFVRQCFVGELSYGAVDKHYQLKGDK